MIKETLLSQALERPGNKICYFVGEQLAKRYCERIKFQTGFTR